MSDASAIETTPDAESGPPKQFGIVLPGWWPRVEPIQGPIDREPTAISPEQEALLEQLADNLSIPDGTKCVSIMMTAEDEPRPFGLLYLNHSAEAGRIMAGMAGLDAAGADLGDLGSVGNLDGVELSVVHFDTVGSVSCVTARRANAANPDAPDALVRGYLIPEPKSLRAAMVLYHAEYQEAGVEAFCDMCDLITASFTWKW